MTLHLGMFAWAGWATVDTSCAHSDYKRAIRGRVPLLEGSPHELLSLGHLFCLQRPLETQAAFNPLSLNLAVKPKERF
jgi:hypothetical protein